jgi:hypothetical protein
LPVERLKITSDRIVIRNSNNIITFDTNSLYLKTDPTALFKLGGYTKCPLIYGWGSTIGNYDNGWYPAINEFGFITPNTNHYTQIVAAYDLPRFNSIKIVKQASDGVNPNSWKTYSAYGTARFNGANIGQFRWIGKWDESGEYDSNGNPYFAAQIELDLHIVNSTDTGPWPYPVIINPEQQGYWEFPAIGFLEQWSSIYYNGSTPIVRYFSEALAYPESNPAYSAFAGYPRLTRQVWMTLSNPINVGMAVTA